MKTDSVYEPPLVEAVSRHFVPDNSGSCCPICGDGVYEGYRCDECPPWRAVCDYKETYKRRAAEFPDPKLWAFAKTVPDEGISYCLRDIYPVRTTDGVGHLACYYCIVKNHGAERLAFCDECHFFYPAPMERDGRCQWCAVLGTLRSMLHAAGLGRRGVYLSKNIYKILLLFWHEEGVGNDMDVEEQYKHRRWYGKIRETKIKEQINEESERLENALKTLKSANILTSSICDCKVEYSLHLPECIAVADERRAKFGTAIARRNKYRELVELLDTPDYRKRFARMLASLGIRGDDDEVYGESSIEKLFEKLEIYYYSFHRNQLNAVKFIAKHETERFARDPEVGGVFRAYAETDPGQRIRFVLRTGIGMAWAQESVSQLVRETWNDMGKQGNLLVECCSRYPAVPLLLWYVHFLENGCWYRPEGIHLKEKTPVFKSVIKLIAEDEGLALALIAWGFWHYEGLNGPKIAEWWLDIAQALDQRNGRKAWEILDRSREFAEGEKGLPRPAKEHRAALEAFVEKKGYWSKLARLLSGMGVECGDLEFDFLNLVEMSFDNKGLQPIFDERLNLMVQQLGGDRYLRKTPLRRRGIEPFLERSGKFEILFYREEKEVKRRFYNYRLGDRFSELCVKLDRPLDLRKHLGNLRSHLDEKLKKETGPSVACPRTFPIVFTYLQLAVIEGALGQSARMQEWVATATALLEHKLSRCRESNLPVSGYDTVFDGLQEMEPQLRDDPAVIVDFIEAHFETGTEPEESDQYSSKENKWRIFNTHPNTLARWREMLDYLAARREG